MKDPLAATIDQIREQAKSLNLTVFYSSVPNDERRTIHWNDDHGGDWKSFLECARNAGIKLVYLHWEIFEQSELDDALGADTENEESQDEEDEALIAQIEQFQDRVGLTACLEIAFINDGISHIFYESADWLSKFEELIADDSEEIEDFDVKEPKVDAAVVNKWARELASHPKYSGCKSGDEREFLLEQIAGTEFPKIPLWPTIRRAETIFAMEIKDQEEERLSAQAREMRRQGLNMNAIAKKLKISRDRVSGLLAEGSGTK